VPTGNNDAINNKGAIAGTTLLEDVITISTDGKTELATVDGKAATTGGGIIATKGFATTAVVPTDGVGTVTFIETGIWPDTAAVGPIKPSSKGTTWGWTNAELTFGGVRGDGNPSIPIDTTGVANPDVECWVGTGNRFLALITEVETAVGGCTVGHSNDCCGPTKVGTLALAFTTDTVAVSVDTP